MRMSYVERSKSSLAKMDDVVYHIVNLNDGFVPPNPTWTAPARSEYFTTYDERKTAPVRPAKGERKQWHSFEHYKAFRSELNSPTGDPLFARMFEYEPRIYNGFSSGSRFGVTGYTTGGLLVHPFGEPGLPIQGLEPFLDRTKDTGWIPVPSDLTALELRAMSALMPGIKAGLSSVNSVIELKDFHSLPKTLKGIAKFTYKGGKTLRKALQTGSDGYLQAKFNVLPLLSDITGLHNSLVNVEKRIRALLHNVGRPQVKHFTCTVSEFHDNPFHDTDGFWLPYQLGTQFPAAWIPYTYFTLERRAVHEPSVFHAELAYSYTLDAYQIEHARILGLLDSIGVNLNPAIIWNALPWSFVVDWVLNIGQVFDSLKHRNLEPRVNIRKYCWSILRKRKIFVEKRCFSITDFAQSGGFGRSTTLPVTTETAYRRDVGMPSGNLLVASGLNASEFSLGAALVFTRKPRRSTRR